MLNKTSKVRWSDAALGVLQYYLRLPATPSNARILRVAMTKAYEAQFGHDCAQFELERLRAENAALKKENAELRKVNESRGGSSLTIGSIE